jgi:hypothetical protein
MLRSAKSKLSIQVRWLATLFAIAAPCSAQTIDTMALRAHTRFLASDLLEGRGTGTRGEHLAAQYIASELTRLGARPLAGNDYLLPVPLKRALIDNAATSMSFRGVTYASVRDFVWSAGGSGALKSFSGTPVFVGAADSVALRRAPELRGAVAVLAGSLGAAAQSYVPELIKAGASGIVLLTTEAPTYDLFVRSRGPARYFVAANVNDPVWQADLPIVIAGPQLARVIVGNAMPERFTQLDGTLSANFKATIEDVRATNVAGVIPGSDPKLASEYVAYSAHYDHLGISTPDARGDSIYNGFSDNAAGVAMLLAIGDAMRRKPPARSTLLLFFTGEERGLLGSSYFAAQPPVPLERIAALINLDAGAPPAPPLDWRIAGGSASPLGAKAQKALAARSWQAQLSQATPNSDYWPFLARGVSAVFLIPGNRWEGVSEEQQRALRARWDRYHQAGDHWSPDFPFTGLKRYADAALAIGLAAAGRGK